LHWWRKLWPNSADPPLTGTASLARVKTYHADSGHVYHYRFAGRRQAAKDVEEYLFHVGAQSVSVVQNVGIFEGWRETHGRELTSDERFGFAKMFLRNAMDAAPSPAELPSRIVADIAGVETISSILDL
jgi:hypothetical protein